TLQVTESAAKTPTPGPKSRELGVNDAGEVKDRLNVNPAYRPPARPIESPPSPSPAAKTRNTETPAAAAEPAKPERRCFTVHTAKGSVTRCNDNPDEP